MHILESWPGWNSTLYDEEENKKWVEEHVIMENMMGIKKHVI